MKHHQYNRKFIFISEPAEFNKHTDISLLKYCLGATLYMPATKDVVDKILNDNLAGLTTMVMCFEDAIAEKDLARAEKNVINHLNKLAESINIGTLTYNDIPLIFLRPRSTEQFRSFISKLTPENVKILTGFVFPKFDIMNGVKYFELLEKINQAYNEILYGMPILEGINIALNETRLSELHGIKNLLNTYRDLVLNLRVGSNDFSSFFGVRRGINYSIYDILTVRDCLADILNCFNRVGEDYIISAPVWEYFLAGKKKSIDCLLEDDIHVSLLKRRPIVNEAIDGLLREVILDKANGFVGKTIIHPSHLRYVNAMQAVTKEEYDDAFQVLQLDGGVAKGLNNKMNEASPHKNWAKKIVARAKAYGVIKNEAAYFKLFS